MGCSWCGEEGPTAFSAAVGSPVLHRCQTRVPKVWLLLEIVVLTSIGSQDRGTLCLTAADSKTQGLLKLCFCVQPEGFVPWQGRAGWHLIKNVQAGHLVIPVIETPKKCMWFCSLTEAFFVRYHWLASTACPVTAINNTSLSLHILSYVYFIYT